MANLRSSTEIYLLGHEYAQIFGSKLPSNKQVLCVFFYNHRTVNLTIRESAALTIREVSVFWSKARIPVRKEQHCIMKLEALHNEWKSLRKNKNKSQEVFRGRENDFVNKLNDLFDIAQMDALSLMANEIDKKFLLSQREKGRPGSLIGVDLAAVQKEKRKLERTEAEASRKRKYIEERDTPMEVDLQGIMSSSESENERKNSPMVHVELMDMAAPGPSTRARKSFITPRILAALDKCKISDRTAIHLIFAVAEALGHSIDELILNRTTLRRIRQTNRVETAERVKNDFQVTAGIAHWDGKILPELTGMETVDRLPVIISHTDGDQLLAVPKIFASTGLEMAEAVFESLVDWNATDKIVAACFDTTSSNSGRLNGAAITLERKLGRSLLYLPCRHHICEITLRAAFESKMGSTSGVNVPIFVRFKNSWTAMNKDNFKAGIEDDYVKAQLNDAKSEIIAFCINELAKDHARDDYKELLEITLIFLGVFSKDGVRFRMPGPMHHARWMSKAIYSLKLYIFRDEFKLTAREEKNLRDICIFVVRFYVKVWFRSSAAAEAPRQDLTYLREMNDYKRIDKKLSQAVINKICKHLWYLSDESIAFSFFDENISNEEKREMVQQFNVLLLNNDVEMADEACKRIELKVADVNAFIKKRFSEFITPHTADLFDRFNISKEFLKIDPDMWQQNEDFKNGMEIVHKIKVVNDIAERGVKLIQDYNKRLTKNEDDLQYLLQVVRDYTRKFPSHTKNSLINAPKTN